MYGDNTQYTWWIQTRKSNHTYKTKNKDKKAHLRELGSDNLGVISDFMGQFTTNT